MYVYFFGLNLAAWHTWIINKRPEQIWSLCTEGTRCRRKHDKIRVQPTQLWPSYGN